MIIPYLILNLSHLWNICFSLGPFKNLKINMFQLHTNVEALEKENKVNGKKIRQNNICLQYWTHKEEPVQKYPRLVSFSMKRGGCVEGLEAWLSARWGKSLAAAWWVGGLGVGQWAFPLFNYSTLKLSAQWRACWPPPTCTCTILVGRANLHKTHSTK